MNKNDVLEILDYMFEFIFSDNSLVNGGTLDDVVLKNYLVDAGFEGDNVDKALEFLVSGQEQTNTPTTVSEQSPRGIRYFNTEEVEKMTKKGCALLVYLEINHTITPETREIIIDHVMSVHYNYSFDEFLWVAQFAALNQDNENLRELLLGIDYDSAQSIPKH